MLSRAGEANGAQQVLRTRHGCVVQIAALFSGMLPCCSKMTAKRLAGNAKRRASSAAQLTLDVVGGGKSSESPELSPAAGLVGDEQRAAFNLEALRAQRPEITPIGMNSKPNGK